MTPPSPLSDTGIARRYSGKSLEAKLENKTALQRSLGWPMEAKVPLIALPLGMSEKLGGETFSAILPGLLALPVELIVLGKGSLSFGKLFTQMAKERGHRFAIIPSTEEAIRGMYAAADMSLFFSDPASHPELVHCLAYGAVPVSPETEMLENYDPVQETGNAFLYERNDPWLAFAALVRATETYKFPFDWRTIQRHGMEMAELEDRT